MRDLAGYNPGTGSMKSGGQVRCHHNRKTGDYHCHGVSSSPRREPQELYRLGAPADGRSVYYPNCAAARAAGAAPIYVGQPGYRAGLDRDGDGDASEARY